MAKSKISVKNIIFIVIIALLIIPQTRKPIQVFMQKGLAMLSPSTIAEDKRETLTTYANWDLTDADGNKFSFKEAEGKVVFINFWATWCPPCIAEMPAINNLYADYNDRVVFLLVSNERLETIQSFNAKHNYDFNFYQSLTSPPNSLKSNTLPHTFVIDKSGAIVINKTGAANWNSDSVRRTLDELLKL